MKASSLIKNKKLGIQPGPDGIAVTCDGAPFRTPAGNPFVVPSRALGEAIISEWRAQGDKINPASMPLNQLAATAIDIVAREREALIDQVEIGRAHV